jgi:hypothetical protein
MKDPLQKWMDKHMIIMTLSGDQEQEKQLKTNVQNAVRKKLTQQDTKLFGRHAPAKKE